MSTSAKIRGAARGVAVIALALTAAGCTMISAGNVRQAPTTLAGADPSAALEGELFVDPEGAYELIVGSEWLPNHGSLAPGVEVWYIGELGAFTTNLNIISQPVPETMTLDDYIELSLENSDIIPGFALIDQQVLPSRGDHRLAMLVYDGTLSDMELRFLGMIAVGGGNAVVATLTTRVDDFDGVRAEVEPYLRSLVLR